MKNQTLLGIGVYKKEDYEEIRKISEDRDNMDATWKEWKNSKRKVEKNFLKKGFKTIDILVQPGDLFRFARENGKPINGTTRAEYVTSEAEKRAKEK